MGSSRNLDAFATHRLGGEPVPEDVKILLAHADELVERTGIELNWKKDWAPWSDTSYLSAADRANRDIMANVRAIAEVCGLIAFAAAHEDGEYFGYWRSPSRRRIADSPLVQLDNEGQFSFCGGSTFAEAVLGQTYGDEQFTELRDWLRSLGIAIQAETPDDLAYPEGEPSPNTTALRLVVTQCRPLCYVIWRSSGRLMQAQCCQGLPADRSAVVLTNCTKSCTIATGGKRAWPNKPPL